MKKIEFIAHRINTIDELQSLGAENGVEIDLRDSLSEVYISHDPFSEGELFSKYVDCYNHGTMILNVKSERIEPEILDKLKGKNINYFFLDSTFPMIKLLSDLGEKNIALRFSEYEGLDTIQNMSGKADWVWVDCFTTFPLDKVIYQKLSDWGYKICIVSPELQGQDDKIEIYADYMKKNNIVPDAICSKMHNKMRWCNYFSFN